MTGAAAAGDDRKNDTWYKIKGNGSIHLNGVGGCDVKPPPRRLGKVEKPLHSLLMAEIGV